MALYWGSADEQVQGPGQKHQQPLRGGDDRHGQKGQEIERHQKTDDGRQHPRLWQGLCRHPGEHLRRGAEEWLRAGRGAGRAGPGHPGGVSQHRAAWPDDNRQLCGQPWGRGEQGVCLPGRVQAPPGDQVPTLRPAVEHGHEWRFRAGLETGQHECSCRLQHLRIEATEQRPLAGGPPVAREHPLRGVPREEGIRSKPGGSVLLFLLHIAEGTTRSR